MAEAEPSVSAPASRRGRYTCALTSSHGPRAPALSSSAPGKATRTNKSFIGVLWSAWSDGVVAHWVELIALEVEAAISSFTDLGPPQTRFTHSCVCPKGRIPGRIFPRFDARTMRAVTRPPSIPFQTTSMPITRAICGDRSPFYAHGPRAHQATPASCPADVNGPMLRMMTTGHVCSDWGWLAGERLAVWPSSGRDR